MRVKKVNIFKDSELENFNSIKTIFFDLQKFNISLMPLHGPILKNELYLGELDTLKDNIGRTRISRWLGRENEENVARTRNCCG